MGSEGLIRPWQGPTGQRLGTLPSEDVYPPSNLHAARQAIAVTGVNTVSGSHQRRVPFRNTATCVRPDLNVRYPRSTPSATT